MRDTSGAGGLNPPAFTRSPPNVSYNDYASAPARPSIWARFLRECGGAGGHHEFVAENRASARDEDGTNPDWIELLNTTAADVNLDGWWLSDDPAVPMKWRIRR